MVTVHDSFYCGSVFISGCLIVVASTAGHGRPRPATPSVWQMLEDHKRHESRDFFNRE